MARRRRRGCINKRRFLTFGLLGLGLCTLFLPTEVKILRMQGELRQLQREEKALLQKQKEMKERVRFYSSDAYVEEAARRDLGLVKPGEVPVLPAVPGRVQPPPKILNDKPYGD